jgi:hypothetical protein
LPSGPYFSVELVDVDADGKLDLLLGGHEWEGAPTSLFINPGSNNFSSASRITIPAVANEEVVLDFTVTGSGATRAIWVVDVCTHHCRLQIHQVAREHIGVLGHYIKACQCVGRQVALVEGNDDLGLSPHGDGQYMAEFTAEQFFAQLASGEAECRRSIFVAFWL